MRHIVSDGSAAGIDDAARATERHAFTGQIDIGGQSLRVSGTLVVDPDARYALASPPVMSRDQLLRDLMTGRPQKKASAGIDVSVTDR